MDSSCANNAMTRLTIGYGIDKWALLGRQEVGAARSFQRISDWCEEWDGVVVLMVLLGWWCVWSMIFDCCSFMGIMVCDSWYEIHPDDSPTRLTYTVHSYYENHSHIPIMILSL